MSNDPVPIPTSPIAISTPQLREELLSIHDSLEVSQDARRLFDELSGLVPITGPVLKVGLNAVLSTMKISSGLKEQKDACERCMMKVMRFFRELALAAEASGVRILPGTASALLLEPVIRKLQDFHTQLRIISELSDLKRRLQRREIKQQLEHIERDLDALIARARYAIILTSDAEEVKARANAQPDADLTRPATPDVKPTFTDKAKTRTEDGKTAVTDLVTVTSPLKDVIEASKMAKLEYKYASQSSDNATPDTRQLSLSDLSGVPQDLVTIFNELAEWTTIAGPFLKIGLGVVQEILKIRPEVKDNKDACDQYMKKVMRIFREFALAAKASGYPILPGSASALLLEPAIQDLRSFHAQIEEYSGWSTFKRTLRRGEIKNKLDGLNKDMDALVIRVGTPASIVMLLRSDAETVKAQAGTHPQTILASPSALSSQASKASANEQLVSIDAAIDIAAETVTTSSKPAEINEPTSRDLLNIARPDLQRVGAAVQEELNRRSSLDGVGAPSDLIQQSKATFLVRPVYPMITEESAQLKQIQDEMRRQYSPGGDGADLAGVYDEETTDGSDDSEDDPGQTAVELLDILCSASASSGKETVSQLVRLCMALDDLGLFEEAVEVATLLTALCRRKLSDSGYPRDRANLASVLIDLSFAFFRVGRWDEADASSSEALTILQDMARREPKRYNPLFATALRIRSVHHSKAGRPDAALQCSQQSIDIYRSLRLDHPNLHGTALSAALNNYSLRLSEAGKHPGALAAIEECVMMYRALHQARPAAYEADLAMALNNYSLQLREAGKHAEALAASKECVKMRWALYQAQPAAHKADLASALSDYSNRLSEAGNHAEALVEIEEYVKMYRDLYQARPAAYKADLASALKRQSDLLGSVGRRGEALASIEESLEKYNDLRKDRPSRYTAELAQAQLSYSTHLSDAGRKGEALIEIRTSVQSLEELYQQDQERYRADLGRALLVYSDRLRDAGSADQALAEIKRSVELFDPRQHRADRAQALLTYSNRLNEAGKQKEALAQINKSTEMYEDLHRAQPSVHRESLARAKLIQSLRLGDADQHFKAFVALEQCVKLRQLPENQSMVANNNHRAVAGLDPSELTTATTRKPDAPNHVGATAKMYKVLFRARHPAYETNLAGALLAHLTESSTENRQEEAFAATQECVPIFTKLHQSLPETYKVDLGRTLFTFLNKLREAGKRETALKVANALCEVGPDECEKDLAEALAEDSEALKDAGKVKEALDAIKLSLKLYGELNKRSPGEFDEQVGICEQLRDDLPPAAG
ncbi:hypothetical protein OC861_006067 [Tilletia horrida]|nr:hypothetical protein OC861_006067 [Tilletia horrida]